MAERKKPKPDPEAVRPANDTVGATLRAARLAKGLEIEAVSQVIHIRSVQIKAIEENNIEALPGMTYAVGFVRSYANFLGLNGAEIVHRFKAEHGHSSVNAQSKLSFPEPVTESRVPDPMMVGVGAFLAVVILVLWTVYSNMHSGGKTTEKLPPAPVVTSVADSLPSATTPSAATTPATTGTLTDQTAAALSAAPPAPVAGTAPVTAATATPPATAVTATAGQPPAAATIAPATPAVPAATQAAPVTAAPAKEAADDADSEDDNGDDAAAAQDDGVIKITHGKSRITLKATEASWVQVTDAHQKVLYRKVLRPGERYSVPDQPGLLLDTANAGGLEVIIDGKRVRALGRDGDIMRGIPLNPQELKQQD